MDLELLLALLDYWIHTYRVWKGGFKQDLMRQQYGKAVKELEAAIAETGAATKKDMGKVMKLVTERAAGRADGKTISAEVGKRLQ